MLVSIIIINYNTFKLTCDCIESIIANTLRVKYEIVVVDNASTKDNPDQFAILFPQIKLVKSRENGGFAKGNNLGIANASGDVILLLNSDTYLKDDSISICADFLKQHPDAGAVSCRLTYEDGSYQKNARKFRSIRNELLDLARPVLKLLPYQQRAKLMLNQYFKGDFDTEVDWVSGAFMMFRKEVLKRLPDGKLDERFFMYGEDHLWGYQIQKAGFKNYYLASTAVVHIANASTEPAKQLALEKTMLERELVIMKYRGHSQLYDNTFKAIYTSKEWMRHQIKALVQRMTGKKMR